MRALGIALGAILLVLLLFLILRDTAPEIEREIQSRGRAVLDAAGMGWASISADGPDVRLSGVAPSAAARAEAERLLHATRGVRSVENAASLARLAPVGARPPSALDSHGCQAEIRQGLEESRIHFRGARYELQADDRRRLDEIAALLSGCPRARIEIAAHTDSSGPAEVNQRLSMDRARSVVRYLVGAGVASERLAIGAYGESQPIAENDTDEGRARNRRIEFRVLGG